MSQGYLSTHNSGSPSEAHSGACSLESFHVVNRSASQAYMLVFDLHAADVTPGTTNPSYIIAIPAGDKASLSLQNPVSHSTALTVLCANGRDGGTGVDCDVFLQFYY